MKLNTRTFRYLSPEDWRVLTAVEVGSKNHEIVPTGLIIQLSGLQTGSNGVQKCISTLAKADLVARVRKSKYDGYRLTYGGLDYLALRAHTKSNSILHIGSQMGVGKESDIYLVMSPINTNNTDSPFSINETLTSHLTPATIPSAHKASIQDLDRTRPYSTQSILKIHRLGRISFRTLARNRDYHRYRQHCSWQYLSRLSAQKEYTAMRALHEAGFPVPQPIAHNRHTLVMSLVPGVPLKDVTLSAFELEAEEGRSTADVTTAPADGVPSAIAATAAQANSEDNLENNNEDKSLDTYSRDNSISALYDACIELSMRLASHGLIHGDLNEFNILIENVPDPSALPSTRPRGKAIPMIPHLIDFPQIISLSHPDAAEYFARDIACIKSFFEKRYHFIAEDPGPAFADAQARLEEAVGAGDSKRLDVAIEAAGFSTRITKELEQYFVQDQHEEEDPGTEGDHGDNDGEYDDSYEGEIERPAKEVDLTEDKATISDALRNSDKTRRSGQERLNSVQFDSLGGSPSAPPQTLTQKLESFRDDAPTNLQENERNTLLASRLASVSLSSRQTPQSKVKAAAGWSI